MYTYPTAFCVDVAGHMSNVGPNIARFAQTQEGAYCVQTRRGKRCIDVRQYTLSHRYLQTPRYLLTRKVDTVPWGAISTPAYILQKTGGKGEKY